MKWLSARAHITLGLIALVTSALFLAAFLELIPDRDAATRQGRLALAEAEFVAAESNASEVGAFWRAISTPLRNATNPSS